MMKADYLSRRGNGGIWYVRLRVPADLVAALGKKEFVCSLKTSDRKEAIRRGRAKLEEWESSFDRARIRTALSEDDLATAAVEHYKLELANDMTKRDARPSADEIESQKQRARQELIQRAKAGDFDWENRLERLVRELDFPVLFELKELDRQSQNIRLRELRKHLADGETALITYAADTFIARHGLEVDSKGPTYRALCLRLLRAEIEVMERLAERDLGNYGGAPKDPLLTASSPSKMSFQTFGDIILAQEKLSRKGLGGRKSDATLRKYRTITKEFATWRGDARVATVTKREVEDWRDELLSIQNPKTVRDKVSCLRTIVEWGQRQSDGLLFAARSPLDTVLLPTIEMQDSTSKTYSLEQAKVILAACRVRQERYLRWIPWIIAYSGARISEVMQLDQTDFFVVGDHWFYAIRVGHGRTTKNNQARNVPVHPALVAEGLIDFVQTAPEGRLFPEARAEQNLRDWIREEVLPDLPNPRPKPNHGFRHLFEDLRRGHLDAEAANYITGRSNRGSAEVYGKSRAMLPALAEQMARFPTLL